MGNALPHHCCYAPCLNAADALMAHEEHDDEGSAMGTGQKQNKNVFARSAAVLTSSDRALADLETRSDRGLADVLQERDSLEQRDFGSLEREEPRGVEREVSLDSVDKSSTWSFGQEQKVSTIHTTRNSDHLCKSSPGMGVGAVHGLHNQGKAEPGGGLDSRSESSTSQDTFTGFQEVEEIQRIRSNRENSSCSSDNAIFLHQREAFQLPARIEVDH